MEIINDITSTPLTSYEEIEQVLQSAAAEFQKKQKTISQQRIDNILNAKAKAQEIASRSAKERKITEPIPTPSSTDVSRRTVKRKELKIF